MLFYVFSRLVVRYVNRDQTGGREIVSYSIGERIMCLNDRGARD